MDIRPPATGDTSPGKTRLERASYWAQLLQLGLGALALLATLVGILFVAFQLRENSMVAWRTYLDERGAQLSDRITGEEPMTPCLFRYEIESIDVDCKQRTASVKDIRMLLLQAGSWINFLAEIDYFDYMNAPSGLRGWITIQSERLGFSGLWSELAPWYADLRRDLAKDPSGAVSFVLTSWKCDGDFINKLLCAENSAKELGLCTPSWPDPAGCDGESARSLGCAVVKSCREGDYPSCIKNWSSSHGICLEKEKCLCLENLQKKTIDFRARGQNTNDLGNADH